MSLENALRIIAEGNECDMIVRAALADSMAEVIDEEMRGTERKDTETTE